MIHKVEIKVSTTGSAGSASGSSAEPIAIGELVDVYLDYHASAPATTDVTISAPGNPALRNLLVVSNNATDGWYPAGVQIVDSSASAITGAYKHPIIHGGVLDIAIAQADALTDCVVATCYVRT